MTFIQAFQAWARNEIRPQRNFLCAMILIATATLSSFSSFAAPSTVNVNGRIVKSDGTALNYNDVTFTLTLKDPAGSCVIFSEQISNYDMSASNGYFNLALGSGTALYPSSGTLTLVDFFSNATALNCQGGGSYSPSASDGRLVNIKFHDGISTHTFSPDSVVRATPYAMSAQSSEKLGSFSANDFVKITGLPTCAAGTYLIFNGTSFSCAAAASGTVTSVTAGAGLQGGPITSTGSLSLASSGVTAGVYGSGTAIPQLTVDQYGRITSATTNALSAANLTGTLAVAKGGTGATTLTANTLLLGNGTSAISSLGTGTAGQILTSTGAGTAPSWQAAPTSITVSGAAGYVPYLSTTSNLASSAVYYNGTNVGIGTTSPSSKLHVVGDILGSANVSAVAFLYTSDRRLKKDIRTIEDPLGIVSQLHGVRFNWRGTEKPDVGFIAQEVEETMPELVNTGAGAAGAETKSVKYGNIVAIVVEAVKSLLNQVDGMEERLHKVEQKNIELEKENARLREELNHNLKIMNERLGRLEEK